MYVGENETCSPYNLTPGPAQKGQPPILTSCVWRLHHASFHSSLLDQEKGHVWNQINAQCIGAKNPQKQWVVKYTLGMSVCLCVWRRVCACLCDVVKILLGKHIVLGQGSEPGWLHTCHYFWWTYTPNSRHGCCCCSGPGEGQGQCLLSVGHPLRNALQPAEGRWPLSLSLSPSPSPSLALSLSLSLVLGVTMVLNCHSKPHRAQH